MGNLLEKKKKKLIIEKRKTGLLKSRKPECMNIYKYNILFIGEPGTGTKTSLIKRIKEGIFIENIKEYKEINETIILERTYDDEYLLYLIDRNAEEEKIYLTDPEQGKKKYFSISIPNYYKNADIIIMGYDVTNKRSFEEIKSFWYKIIKEKSNASIIYLLGNKIDLKDNIEVNENEVKEFTEMNKIKNFLISVKNDINIKEFYNDLKMTVYNIPINKRVYKGKKEIIYGNPSRENYIVILLGDSGIGKTCFLKALQGERFDENYINTEPSVFNIKTINLENENQINLNLWDISGQEKYRSFIQFLLKNYYDCVILGYDITKTESFYNIKNYWFPMFKDNKDINLIYLLSFKNDKYELREVRDEEAENYSKKNNMRFFSINSFYNYGIEYFLDNLTNELVKR